MEHSPTNLPGPAEDKIVAQARKQRSNLIVMGTAGLPGLERLQVGSATERAAQSTLCCTRTQ